MKYIDVFQVKSQIEYHGVWYAIWFHGFSKHALWTVFVATRMIQRDKKQFAAI